MFDLNLALFWEKQTSRNFQYPTVSTEIPIPIPCHYVFRVCRYKACIFIETGSSLISVLDSSACVYIRPIQYPSFMGDGESIWLVLEEISIATHV